MIIRRSTARVGVRRGYGWVQFIPAIMDMISPKTPVQAYIAPPPSNTGLYVVGGLLGAALVGGLLYVAVKA